MWKYFEACRVIFGTDRRYLVNRLCTQVLGGFWFAAQRAFVNYTQWLSPINISDVYTLAVVIIIDTQSNNENEDKQIILVSARYV